MCYSFSLSSPSVSVFLIGGHIYIGYESRLPLFFYQFIRLNQRKNGHLSRYIDVCHRVFFFILLRLVDFPTDFGWEKPNNIDLKDDLKK